MNSKELFFKLKEEGGYGGDVDSIKPLKPIPTSVGSITEVYREGNNYFAKVNKVTKKTSTNARFYGR